MLTSAASWLAVSLAEAVAATLWAAQGPPLHWSTNAVDNNRNDEVEDVCFGNTGGCSSRLLDA